ncbi:MAG: flagellar biosynthetic protein FliO [Stellaceae bacterium]
MTSGVDGFGSLFIEIAGIVVLLWLALWFFTRRGRSPGAWSARDCQVLRQLPLGPRERVIVVRIGQRQLVLGVGATAVSLLCELSEPLPVGDSAAGPFGDAMRKALGKWRVG